MSAIGASVLAGLVLALALVLFTWWLRRKGDFRPGTAIRFADVTPLLATVAAVLASWGIFHFYAIANLNGTDFKTGFSASLLEDIIFFSVVGVILFVLQKADFYRGRRLEDRVDYLFNAKKLSSEERSYLKQEIQAISCDFIRDETVIDIVEYDAKFQLVKLDVARKFLIGNYVREQNAVHRFESRIAHDDMPDARDAMEIYPVSTKLVREKVAGRHASGGPVVDFDDFDTVGRANTHGIHESRKSVDPAFALNPPLELAIKPGQFAIVEVRWRGWQPVGPSKEDPAKNECFEVEFIRHWDAVSFELRNSLKQDVEITLEALNTAEPYTLQSGMGCDKEWSGLDVTPGTKVLIRFTKL